MRIYKINYKWTDTNKSYTATHAANSEKEASELFVNSVSNDAKQFLKVVKVVEVG